MAHSEDERTLYIGEITEPEFFNKGVKNRYLKSLNVNIEENEKFFKGSAMTETWNGKDIYQFTDEELELLFHSYGYDDDNQLKHAYEIVEEYINWAIRENLTRNSINIMHSWSEYKNKY